MTTEPATSRETISTGRGVLMVAGGILAAIAVLWVIAWLRTPSDVDCALQRADVLLDKRDAVESGCEDR